MKWRLIVFYLSTILLLGPISCGPDEVIEDDLSSITYDPSAYDLVLPRQFPAMDIPAENPITVEGVALGRRLFYDNLLSADFTMNCGTCHEPSASFTDNLSTSPGIDGKNGRRSSMSLLNVGFVTKGLFWDGRINTLEEQAIIPVEDPIELHNNWPEVEKRLQADPFYPALFRKAFGINHKNEITRDLAAKAIAQFERTIVSSGRSKYDRVIAGEAVFTDEELMGHNIFFDIDPDLSRHAECGHCHNAPLFSIDEFLNNGISNTDIQLADEGRKEITGQTFDNGLFRVPSLRNIGQSGPYMHDGRFNTLDEVIDHYTTGGHPSRNISPILRPLSLSAVDRAALVAFIKTLEDPSLADDSRYSSPF